MNSSYYETLDENFNKALELYEKNYSYTDLISLLDNGNIVQKQIAVLKLEEIKSKQDANILVSNLIGQDGKVREVVSFKLKEFISNPNLIEYFLYEENYIIFLSAIIDVNGNVCRNIINTICLLKSNTNFCQYFCKELTQMTFSLIDSVNEFEFQDGKYKVNKEVFKLYWCLETIFEFYEFIDVKNLKEILIKTQSINEYTIREKTAKILTKNFDDNELLLIKTKLKKDENYYVRRY